MKESLRDYFKKLYRIGISDREMKKPIYRFIAFEKLLEIIINRQIQLIKPKLWEDPFENYLSKCNIFLNQRSADFTSLQEMIFGQCWTLKSESDALWRIYSPDKKGIRIKTTLHKLDDAVYQTGQSFIGKVNYSTKDVMMKHFSAITDANELSNSMRQIETYLWKRKEFEHEQEIRVLNVIDTKSIDLAINHKNFYVDPNSFIEEICFDSRMDWQIEKIYIEPIKALGYFGRISKSNLYSFEPVTINLK